MYKVLVRNVETNVWRIAHVVVLDSPRAHGHSSDSKLPLSHSAHTMLIFPSLKYPQNDSVLLDGEVAYLSPLLAFNLDLHISCLKSLVHQGKETLASLFEAKADEETCGRGSEASPISLSLEQSAHLPRFASHLRASFVKIPECGTLESLQGNSSIEAEDRQEMIDLALHNYFKVDRYLARGDLFSVGIKWNCRSVMCIPCSQRMQNASDDIIHFKVNIALFPQMFSSAQGMSLHKHVLRWLFMSSTTGCSCPLQLAVHVLRLWLWNQQMNQFFESIALKLPLCLEEVFHQLFHLIC